VVRQENGKKTRKTRKNAKLEIFGQNRPKISGKARKREKAAKNTKNSSQERRGGEEEERDSEEVGTNPLYFVFLTVTKFGLRHPHGTPP
jgi:hypothetical protein